MTHSSRYKLARRMAEFCNSLSDKYGHFGSTKIRLSNDKHLADRFYDRDVKTEEFQFIGFGHADLRTIVMRHCETGHLTYGDTCLVKTEDMATIRQKKQIRNVANQLLEQINNTNSPEGVVKQIAKLLVTGEADITSMMDDNV